MQLANEVYYIVHNDGVTQVTQRVRHVPNPEAVLRQYAETQGVTIPMVGVLDGRPVHLRAQGEAITAAVSLPSLTLSTWFSPWLAGEGQVFMVPIFTHSGPGSVEATFEWRPPGDCRLWFVVRWSTHNGAEAAMVAVHHPETGQVRSFKLPLPNIYGDGRVCMGNGWIPSDDPRRTVIDRLRAEVEWFRRSTWNVDLMPRVDHLRALFRWTPDGVPAPVEGPWTDACEPVSNELYNFVGDLPHELPDVPDPPAPEDPDDDDDDDDGDDD